jgi:protein-S-isoprenylcysteine O-methyltransferase Ste14
MADVYRLIFPVMWLSWALYWFWAARHAKQTERREPIGSRLLHVVPLLLAVWLLWGRVPVALGFLNHRIFPWSPWTFGIAALVTAAGLLFTVWARIHLGRNWSGTVTIKHDHELIETGPYAVVRHPIYTGLLLAFLGSGAAHGEWRGVLAVLIAWLAFWRKLGLEERWMTERFGERYRAYRERVPALVPFWR